jgi:hypothetical protein
MPLIVCRGCQKEFVTKASRKKICDECVADKQFYTRHVRYGLTRSKFQELLDEKNGLCALCHRQAEVIDHNHSTQVIRGILCRGCNLALGRLEEDMWLELALRYLKERQ